MDARSIPCLKNLVHHRVTEGAERKIYFFVYRELPIDEKILSNLIHDRVILQRPNPEDRGAVRAFVYDSSTCRGGGTEAAFSAIS